MGELMNYSYYNVILWKKNSSKRCYPKHIAHIEAQGGDQDYLMFLKFENHYAIPNIDSLIAGAELLLNAREKTMIILTTRKAAPPYTASEDEYVYSFCCELKDYKTLSKTINKTEILSTDLLFELLDQIAESHSPFEQILVRQIPFDIGLPSEMNQCDVIVPHRGDNEYLRTALKFLNQIDFTSIYVGIDQTITKDTNELITRYNEVDFYNFSPTPVGPYVIRNWLIDQGNNPLIFFQDSDDIPCGDRFPTLSAFMHRNNCQMCGSHELRMDYFNRKLLAVRFPEDVKAALTGAPYFPLLHPTACITRKAFYDCGKLSEERIFGNDTKFLLYSYFVLSSIRNIPEFLYIRKTHPGSLTTSPETMLGSALRRNLNYQWNCDFQDIKDGLLKKEDSNLPPVLSVIPIEKWKCNIN